MAVRLRILPTSDGRGPPTARAVEIAAGAHGIRIGRGAELELPLPFAAVEPLHARIFRDGGRWLIEDLGGAAGTWLGARRLPPGEPFPLAPGAELAVAHVALVFDGEAAPGAKTDGTATIARRLVADLLASAPEGRTPELTVVTGAEAGRRLALRASDRRYVVGRGAGCDLALDSDEISREHAAFVWTAEGVVVSDLGSKNGVTVDGARLEGPRRLRDRERVAVGPVWFELHDPVERYLTALAPPLPPAAPPPSSPTAETAAAAAPPAAVGVSSRPAPARPPSRTGRLMVAIAIAVLAALAAAAVALLAG